ncbi:hypothetical protein TH63_15125 [Rufibacter radiotolerans]|uniref:Uncharacterized protein n=1 Tax=Rufibacter radiotolerans TaxID=1379910 RepID=A0A0H4VRU1_9BACT|nr:hypothetical protein [Rufibacter radiotolerans]AKQ46652.1 hypothetical protein TH63_15125 [Rufibacter radiotolerans]
MDPDKFIASHAKKYPDMTSRIKKHKEDVFYIITNQEALYPFAEWSDDAGKDFIISRLSTGIGP